MIIIRILFLIIVVVLITLQDYFKKIYNTSTKEPNTFFYALLMSLSALVFFVVQSGFTLDFNMNTLPYSIGFALAYSSALAGSFFAIKYGSLSITVLVISYSLVIPTLYGIFGFGDNVSVVCVIGLVLLLISLFLINKTEDRTKINLKWIVSSMIAFVGNGMCSLIQKLQQSAFDGEYKSEFMIFALFMSSVFLFIFSVIHRENMKTDLRLALPLAVGGGVANGVTNYLVMMLTGLLPSVVLFPTISAGGIVMAFFLAFFLYKERLTKVQLIGYVAGIVSVILLNL